jgi:excisionase family DNA binding protein
MQTIEPNFIEQALKVSPDRVLSLEEASKYLGVSQAALRTWKRRGKAPAFFRAGRLLRFRKRDLDRWIEGRLVTPQHKQ